MDKDQLFTLLRDNLTIELKQEEDSGCFNVTIKFDGNDVTSDYIYLEN